MSITVPVVMFGWIPAVFVLFMLLPPRRAVMAAFLGTWLFLPMAGYKVEGLPEYDKMSATCLGVLLATIVFDVGRYSTLRLTWLDLPMAAWCLVPFASSVTNNLGAYDGVSAVFRQTVTWGLPYLVGRVYFRNLADLRELAIGIFIGGLIYVPLCLYEIKMSPQLHHMVYGFFQHDFGQTKRFGGWRPTVFMQHGLMVGMWMTTASLVGTWLWYSGALRRLGRFEMKYLVPVLLVTTILCKSTGAIALLVVGLAVLYVAARWRLAMVLVGLAVLPSLYMAVRATGTWSGEQLVSMAQNINDERAQSMQMRVTCETRLAARAMQRPLFGWGGWGEWRMTVEEGDLRDTVSDMLWCIAFGKTGLVGLTALTTSLLLPPLVLLRRVRIDLWAHPQMAPAAAMAVLLILYTIDNLFNAMINPIFMLCAGALGSFIGAGALAVASSKTPRAQGVTRCIEGVDAAPLVVRSGPLC